MYSEEEHDDWEFIQDEGDDADYEEDPELIYEHNDDEV